MSVKAPYSSILNLSVFMVIKDWREKPFSRLSANSPSTQCLLRIPGWPKSSEFTSLECSGVLVSQTGNCVLEIHVFPPQIFWTCALILEHLIFDRLCPMPPYGRRTYTGSPGQDTVRGVLNASHRVSGAHLGLDNSGGNSNGTQA